MDNPGPSRRRVLTAGTLLTAGALVSAGGCTQGSGPEPTPPPDPDAAVRRRAVARTRRLIAAYTAATAARPDLRGELDPLAAEHRAHLTALRATDPRRTGSPPASATSPGATSAATPAPTGPKPTAAQVRHSLAAAERAAAAERIDQAVAASPVLARLIGSIGASEAAHVAVLAGRA